MTSVPEDTTFPTTPREGESARPPLALRRTGTRTFEASTTRGQTLKVGPASEEGAITPGELLQIALAGCHAMSADARMARALGDDHTATWWIRAIFGEEADTYTAFDIVADVDLSELNAEEVAKTTKLAAAAIKRTCTIGHTLEGRPDTTVSIGARTTQEQQ